MSANVPRWALDEGRGALHETKDRLGVFRALTSFAERATTVAEVPDTIARAFRAMRNGRPLPAYVEVPTDVLSRGPCFLSFDIDLVDTTYAPGTGIPEVGGFTSWETLELVRGLVGLGVVAFDVVEVAPPYDDPGATTCVLAADLVHEFISLLAVARRGAARSR